MMEEEEEEYVSKPTQCSAKLTLRSDRTAAEATSTFRTPVDDGHVPNYTIQTMWTPHRQPTFARCRARPDVNHGMSQAAKELEAKQQSRSLLTACLRLTWDRVLLNIGLESTAPSAVPTRRQHHRPTSVDLRGESSAAQYQARLSCLKAEPHLALDPDPLRRYESSRWRPFAQRPRNPGISWV